MFLNLSNHRLETWPSPQREAALALGLGPLTDLPVALPWVSPSADTPAVVLAAEQLADQALALGARGAFVAGDYTFTVALVHALQLRGIRCFAATSERLTQETQDGDRRVKHTTYRFVRWREYPDLTALSKR